jgi:hypothetical protein
MTHVVLLTILPKLIKKALDSGCSCCKATRTTRIKGFSIFDSSSIKLRTNIWYKNLSYALPISFRNLKWETIAVDILGNSI